MNERSRVSSSLLRYGAVMAGVLLLTVLAGLSSWRSSGELHTALEAVAAVLALVVGVIALIRFYAGKSNTYLLIGVGFLGTALLDAYHAVVSTSLFAGAFPWSHDQLVPWSREASRTFLSLMMVASWWASRRERDKRESGRIGEVGVYLGAAALMLSCVTFFAVAPLPRVHHPDLLIASPQALGPALVFLAAIVGFVSDGGWRGDPFERWLILSLSIGFVSEAFAMSRSSSPFDAMFDTAHVLKIVGYGCVSVGLFISMSQLFRRAEGRTSVLRDLNESLKQQVDERLRAEQALAEVASRLALPPGSEDVASSTFTVSRFSLKDMMACGAAIRGLVRDLPARHRADDGSAPTLPDHAGFAERLVRYLRDHLLDDDGQPAFALVRLFETRRFEELSAGARDQASALSAAVTDKTRCLTLLGTAGELDAWNDVARSAQHRAIPLVSKLALTRLPMISQLIRQLGFEVGGILQPERQILLRRTMGVFHVPDARGSPMIPAQSDFVAPFGIRSVVGFGDLLPDGKIFAVILFSKVSISPDVAYLLSHLAHSTRTALLSLVHAPDQIEAQIVSLDRLLANHEAIVADQEERLRATLAELTKSNAELVRSNDELDEFANVVAHDLRSPLRNIESLADWIVKDTGGGLPEESRRHLALLRERVDRLHRLLDDLRQYARVGRKESQPVAVDTGALVREIAEMVATPDEFTVEVEDGMPVLHTPPTAIRRVFQNLIDNAIKHHDRPDGLVRISCRDLGPLVEFTVEDDGPGIPPRHHETVFQIFQTLTRRGDREASGIGLALVRKTVEVFGGQIRIDAKHGRGAAFRFTWRKTP